MLEDVDSSIAKVIHLNSKNRFLPHYSIA